MRRSWMELDGLRAVAIFLVAGNHYCHFWTPSGDGEALLPYGDALQWMPFASFSGLGVAMFFVISAFMMMQALERSETLGRFAALRAIRLWPTLLICGALTYAATTLLGPPYLQRSAAEAAISMSFLPPEHVGKAIGVPGWEWLDGAYWSLWVQVRFFAVLGILHYACGGRVVSGWLAFSALATACYIGQRMGSVTADLASGLMFANHHSYFTAGIGLALFATTPRRRTGAALMALGVVQALVHQASLGADLPRLLSVVTILALVGLAVLAPRTVSVFGWAPLVALGQGSFVFYLLHQSFGLSFVTRLPDMGVLPSILATFSIVAAIAVLSVWAFRRVERPLGRWLRDSLLGPGQSPVRVV